MPNLVGLTVAQAQQTIVNAGLKTTYVNYQTADNVPDKSFFNSIPPGHVLSQIPAPGTSVAKGTVVYLAARK